MAPTPHDDVTAPPVPRRLKTVALLCAVAVALVVAQGVYSRVSESNALTSWTNAQVVPSVSLVSPAAPSAAQALVLPGRLQANQQASIYARVPGYLKQWYTDIGTPVKKGQLLAEIETPDIDAQLNQEKANLASATANARLAQSTAQRWKQMISSDSVSQQAVDEKIADYQAKQAAVEAAQANVTRLEDQESFKRIVAPFDGVVTARHTDIGALIDAGGQGAPLFQVADVSKLRVYVNLPQSYAADVKAGTQAMVTVPEHPGQQFPAQFTSAAGAVTESTGAVLVQLTTENPQNALMPGDYAQVSFSLADAGHLLQLPSTTLILGDHGEQVATMGPDGKVAMKPVTIARDLGAVVQISAGLALDDRVIDNPPDSLANGDAVQAAPAAAAPGTPNVPGTPGAVGAARTVGSTGVTGAPHAG